MMATDHLDIRIIEPTARHTHTIILLHGRDSSAKEFQQELFESQASDDRHLYEIFPGYKWVFPSSKFRMSARFGTDLRQWFDIWNVDKSEERPEIQKEGIVESCRLIDRVIKDEMLSVPEDHIILGGISQGCATAIGTLIQFNYRKLGGFVGFSSWKPATISRTSKALFSVPVFLAHCADDIVVAVDNGRSLRQYLEDIHGFMVVWKEYEEGGHWINEPEGIDDLIAFLTDACQK